MAYTNPTFIDGQAPPINASNLNNMGGAVAGNSQSIAELNESVSQLSTSLQSTKSQVGTLSTSVSNLSATVYVLSNATIATTAWVSSSTFSGFSWQANISFPGISTAYVPIVSFNPSDATNGNFGPSAVAGAGYVTIYAKQKPSGTVTIPSVVAFRQASST